MNNFRTFIHTHILACTGIVVFLAIRSFSYTLQSPMWDESVYVLMGKYLVSAGQVGLLESTRPIVWPALLGVLWKCGLDPVVWGHLLILLFSAGNIVLVYMIGRQVFGRGIGAIAAVLLATSPSSYFWGNSLLTEAPASFLGLLSIYWVVNERYVLSGFAGILSVFTRFVQALNMLPLTVFVFLKAWEKHRLQKALVILRYSAGVIVFLSAFTMIYLRLCETPLQPFTDARALYTRVSYNWSREILACLGMILDIEGGLILFALLNFFLSWRRLTKEQLLIWVIALLQLGWIGKYPIDPLRYFLTSLPYFCLLTASGIVQGYELSKAKKHGYMFAACIIIFSALQCYTMIKGGFPRIDADKLQEYITRHQDKIKGVVWISNPVMVIDTNIRVHELMYYPAFNLGKIAELHTKLPQADFILLDSGNLGCRPLNDPACNTERDRLLAAIKKKFRAEFYYEKPATNDFAGVFRHRQ